jgi:hypothetical protein
MLGFGWTEAGVVEDREEAAQLTAPIKRADIRDGGKQFAG